MNFSILNMAIAEHYDNVEKAICYLVDLARDDIDITDNEIFTSVMKRYDLLDDGFESEREYILEQVKKIM